MEAIPVLGSLLGLAYVSGMRLYTAVLVIGAGVRFGLLELPSRLAALEVFASIPVLAVAAILYGVEFFADKIPGVKSVWDGVHTFIRPLGASVIAVTAAGPAFDERTVVIAIMVLGGAVGLFSHLARPRSPEPVSDALLSVVEDGAVVGGIWLIFTHPVIAAVIFFVLIVCSVAISIWLFRFLRRTIRKATDLCRRLLGGRRRQECS